MDWPVIRTQVMIDDGLEKRGDGNGQAFRHRYHFDSEDGKLNTQNWALTLYW
jgi:hypothetical protein